MTDRSTAPARRIVLTVLTLALTSALGADSARAASAGASVRCGGDCDRDRTVAVNELITGVNIVLGSALVDQCPAFDCNEDGTVTVACLIQAVNRALGGCPSNVANPRLEGPIGGGLGAPFVAATAFDLAEVGYAEAEYFMAGTAAAYISDEPLSEDGMWTAEPGATAAYKTRVLVYRPIDPQRFNGTVIVEWLNVSGGLDAAPDWIMGHTELTRAGYAWVGVSAQFAGVEDGGSIVGLPAMPLKTVDPARYAGLVHPGDSFSYDMFSQVAQAIWFPQQTNVLGGLKPKAVIAAGESQSAFRMVTYVNAIHPLADSYDGFLIHSRSAGGTPLSERPQAAIPAPRVVRIRGDLNVPVLNFQTETDVILFASYSGRQPDTDRFRLWEAAGTAHADTYTVAVGRTDRGDSPAAAALVLTDTPVEGLTCSSPINSGPHHFVLKAAIAALNRWVRDGVLPPSAPRLDVDPGPPVAFRRDDHGNGLGGIRTPQVDVPIATFSGAAQVGPVICALFGSTTPFDAATVASLYPTHDAYVSAFNEATERAVAAGFVLAPDAELMKAAAAQSEIGT
jgi:Alpha/beta hydrolase domain